MNCCLPFPSYEDCDLNALCHIPWIWFKKPSIFDLDFPVSLTGFPPLGPTHAETHPCGGVLNTEKLSFFKWLQGHIIPSQTEVLLICSPSLLLKISLRVTTKPSATNTNRFMKSCIFSLYCQCTQPSICLYIYCIAFDDTCQIFLMIKYISVLK